MTVHDLAPASPPATPRRPDRVRVALAGGAVVACLPYLALKTAWLAGSTFGLRDPSLVHSGVMAVANALTFALEGVALVLAVVLARPARWRLPWPVVGVPMFVGTGLLGGILVLLPIVALMDRFTPADPAPSAPGPIENWVYAAVYGGFVVLGLCLLTLFALHAWERRIRPGGWTAALGGLPAAPVALASAHGAALVAVCAADVVAGARAGILGAHPLVALVAAIAAAAALVALATRRPARLPAWVPLAVAYAGAAVIAAWGAYFAVMLAVPNPLRGEGPVPGGLLPLAVARAVLGTLTLPVLARLRPAPKSP